MLTAFDYASGDIERKRHMSPYTAVIILIPTAFFARWALQKAFKELSIFKSTVVRTYQEDGVMPRPMSPKPSAAKHVLWFIIAIVLSAIASGLLWQLSSLVNWTSDANF